MIRIAVLGPVRLSREALAALLAQDKRIRVTAAARSADQLPDRALVDVLVVATPQEDCSGILGRAAGGAQTPAVVLEAPESERDVIAFAEQGVMGFLEPEAPLDELIATIVSVATGEARFPPRIATMLLRRLASHETDHFPNDVSSLTSRERQIVDLIAEGLSNREIGSRLYIEVATVKNHVHNILEKLQVATRSDAVARLRLVEDGALQSSPPRLADRRATTRSMSG